MLTPEWGSAAVMMIIAFAGAFMSLLLAWFSQNQRLNKVEGRLLEAEKAEKACLERESKLNKRVTELEVLVGKKPRRMLSRRGTKR